MPSNFLKILLRSPLFGSIKIAIAERTIQRNFHFYTTEDEKELEEIYKIRYKVYCEEYKYLDTNKYPNHVEKDEFDKKSIHLVIRHKSGELAATSRLILGSEDGLPILNHFKINIEIPENSSSSMAEISRLIVARKYRKQYLLLVLIKGMYLIVKQKKIQNIFCVLDEHLIPSLRNFQIPLKQIGPPSVFQGYTMPFLIRVEDLENQMSENNRMMYKFLSNGVMHFTGNNYSYAPY